MTTRNVLIQHIKNKFGPKPSPEKPFHVHMKSEGYHIFGIHVGDDWESWIEETVPEQEREQFRFHVNEDGMLVFRIESDEEALLIKMTWLG